MEVGIVGSNVRRRWWRWVLWFLGVGGICVNFVM